MKRGCVLRRVAEKEFDDSIAWYESEREGLGQKFRATIEQYFQRIADNPGKLTLLVPGPNSRILTDLLATKAARPA